MPQQTKANSAAAKLHSPPRRSSRMCQPTERRCGGSAPGQPVPVGSCSAANCCVRGRGLTWARPREKGWPSGACGAGLARPAGRGRAAGGTGAVGGSAHGSCGGMSSVRSDHCGCSGIVLLPGRRR